MKIISAEFFIIEKRNFAISQYFAIARFRLYCKEEPTHAAIRWNWNNEKDLSIVHE